MNKAFRGVRFSLEDHDQDDEERTRNRRTVSKKIQETAIRAITNEDMEPGSIKLMVMVTVSRTPGGMEGSVIVERVGPTIIPTYWEPGA